MRRCEIQHTPIYPFFKVYGDITQSSDGERELSDLLKRFGNDVTKVVYYLEERVRRRGKQTFIPPAFYDREGKFYQPPPFEMSLSSPMDEISWGLPYSKTIE